MLTLLMTIASFHYLFGHTTYAQQCKPKHFGFDSIVCECNSTYCDFYSNPELPVTGQYIWYVTSRSGERLKETYGKISNEVKADYVVTIDSDKEYQAMKGFGGAFTDSACMNIRNLSEPTQDNLMRSYFAEDGSRYNFGRVPIGGTDFSTRPYTLDDHDMDVELTKFSLAKEDYDYKIPLMKHALKLNPSLRFLSSAWSAPVWMKHPPVINKYSYLLEKYHQTYADYIVKFLEEYKKNDLEIWAVSSGNEPFTALIPYSRINQMYWSVKDVSNWILNNLGPSIERSRSNNTIIMILDDQRLYLPWYVIDFKARNKKALDYVKGIAVHWYTDDIVPAALLTATHAIIPEKFLLITEACVGDRPWQYPKVALGSWTRAESLINRLFENLNHWVVGWVDWNLALNTKGGPNWVDNNVDSPIIVIPENDVFYKQPMYYALMHFSKFVQLSSVRIDATSSSTNILSTAFKTPDNTIVVLLYNKYDEAKNVSIIDAKVGKINVELLEKSLHTILYRTV